MKLKISEEVKKKRRKAGLTQKELAKMSGVNVSTIRNIEQGKFKPKLETLAKVAPCIDLDITEIENNTDQLDWIDEYLKERTSDKEKIRDLLGFKRYSEKSENGFLNTPTNSPLVDDLYTFICYLSKSRRKDEETNEVSPVVHLDSFLNAFSTLTNPTDEEFYINNVLVSQVSKDDMVKASSIALLRSIIDFLKAINPEFSLTDALGEIQNGK